MQIISTFYLGNFEQKALIINIVLLLRMSAYAYAYVKVWTRPYERRKNLSSFAISFLVWWQNRNLLINVSAIPMKNTFVLKFPLSF